MTQINRYKASSRFFHWVSAILLVVTWGMYVLHEQASSKEAVGMYMGYHKAFGLSLGFFMVARIINCVLTKQPEPLPMKKAQHLLAIAVHRLLYALIIAQALAGLLMSLYSGREVSFFGLFSIPVLVVPDESISGACHQLHTSVFWPMIWVLTAIHVVGALYHQFVLKDNQIKRMI